MTMEQAIRAEGLAVLTGTFGAERAQRIMEGAQVRVLPASAVALIEARVLVELRETAASVVSWVLLAPAGA